MASKQRSIEVFLGFLVTAGLINAVIVALVLCITPKSHVPSIAALFVRSSLYVSLVSLAGAAGSWIYWKRSNIPHRSDPRLSFSLFLLITATGWMWVPPIVLLSRRDSPNTLSIAAIAAIILAIGLRRILPVANQPVSQPIQHELFAQTLQTVPRESTAYIIVASLCLAGYNLYERFDLIASALLAFCVFLAAWKITLVPERPPENTWAVQRLASVAPFAIFITFVVLLTAIGQNQSRSAALTHVPHAAANSRAARSASALPNSGFVSVILWPPSEKKQLIPPILPHADLTAGTRKPIVIRFDGQYWYYQAPDKGPGAKAHIAHGDPLAMNIRSSNYVPLIMTAHQELGSSIRLACCRELKVAIRNAENSPGATALAILLTDTSSPGKPTLYLNPQPILSTQPGRFAFKSTPVEETLHFPVSSQPKIQKFDAITIVFLTDQTYSMKAPRMSIQQFSLVPR